MFISAASIRLGLEREEVPDLSGWPLGRPSTAALVQPRRAELGSTNITVSVGLHADTKRV